MSGVEVAGLLLGAIPIALEAYDRSERAFSAFDVYRHYPKELKKLEAKLGAQKTVFRNNCINLLSTISDDRSRVYAMLSEPSHSGWQDQDIHHALASRSNALDESFTSCQRTMEQIHEALQSIGKEAEEFQHVLASNSESQENSVSTREWYRRLGKRIKLSINKPRIEEHIEELRTFNADFNLMSNQISKNIRNVEVSRAVTSSPASLPSLLRYQSVRKASEWLYDTLVNRWSCNLHSSHWANISLDNHLRREEKTNLRGLEPEDVSTVHLEMAITYYVGNNRSDIPIWLEILSSVDAEVMVKTFPGLQKLADISNLLQSRSEPYSTEPRDAPKNKVKKSVRFDNDSASLPKVQTLSLKPEPQSTKEGQAEETTLDLCLIQDVCEHFQLYQKHSHQPTCLGYLNNSCIQRFYQPPLEKYPTGKPKSLEDIIIWVSEDPIRILPRSIMIQLAASLAAAILQYHSTPWLSELWRSKDIVFFGLDDFHLESEKHPLLHPHLNVEFTRLKELGTSQIKDEAASTAIEVQQPTAYGARNEVLFHLGVVLLEIGFATPWVTLRANMLKTLPNKAASDYAIADKLACSLVNSMGPTYSRIIRKCLGCDFGLGETNLESEELQGKFLLDVVVTLKHLEEKFPAT
ncbi:hypothetical protein BP6252_13726 [Coleophoma cylindrospora]|uniref:DUF7580 domain-containing protein n=1 Tax=Coleophoma cylindrospora TaxID=1849047 RepID=A0A3D8Q881_9HELO|nr:hypothetical protein BP6252_13726 [Coleophoma cylindrospora]